MQTRFPEYSDMAGAEEFLICEATFQKLAGNIDAKLGINFQILDDGDH